MLCNHVAELRHQSRSNEHLLNFRRSMLSCVVTTFSKNQLSKAGQKLDKRLYKNCKRKRENQEEFLEIDPRTKKGRKPIAKELKEEIELLWQNNSRAAANCQVTNPNNRAQRKTGRRLIMPARHIIIKSKIYKEKRASYGTILVNRLWYVLPPTSDDGICHWCLALRNHIAYIHKKYSIPALKVMKDSYGRMKSRI